LQTIDVDTEIDKISVDLSTIELISPDTKTELTSMRDAIDGIDFTGLKSELSEQTVTADFQSLRTTLQSAADNTQGQPSPLDTVHVCEYCTVELHVYTVP